MNTSVMNYSPRSLMLFLMLSVSVLFGASISGCVAIPVATLAMEGFGFTPKDYKTEFANTEPSVSDPGIMTVAIYRPDAYGVIADANIFLQVKKANEQALSIKDAASSAKKYGTDGYLKIDVRQPAPNVFKSEFANVRIRIIKPNGMVVYDQVARLTKLAQFGGGNPSAEDMEKFYQNIVLDIKTHVCDCLHATAKGLVKR